VNAINEWLKAAVQEVQEYVRLCWAVMKGITSRPFYYRDLIQQLDNIGWGSMTVFMTGPRKSLEVPRGTSP